jgi:hypothetical protein
MTIKDSKNHFDKLNPTLVSLLSSIWSVDKAQEVILNDLFNAARKEAETDREVYRQLTLLLEFRQIKLNDITGQVAREYQRNFQLIKSVTFGSRTSLSTPRPVVATSMSAELEEQLDRPITETLVVSKRLMNRIKEEQLATLRELLWCSEHDLMKVPNLGRLSLKELKQALLRKGLTVGMLVSQRPARKSVKWEGES